jgi:hypothetical protein
MQQMQEKFLAKIQEVWMTYVDLEQAFHWVPRELMWWALRELSVDERLDRAIQAMHEGPGNV